jgi:hypothetical protein
MEAADADLRKESDAIRQAVGNAVDDVLTSALKSGFDEMMKSKSAKNPIEAFKIGAIVKLRTETDQRIENAHNAGDEKLKTYLTNLRARYFGDPPNVPAPSAAVQIFDVIASVNFLQIADALNALAKARNDLATSSGQLKLQQVGVALNALPYITPLLEVMGLAQTFSGVTDVCKNARAKLADVVIKLTPDASKLEKLAFCSHVLFAGDQVQNDRCAAPADAFSALAIKVLTKLRNAEEKSPDVARFKKMRIDLAHNKKSHSRTASSSRTCG